MKFLIIIGLALVLIIVSLGSYLSPDDLAGCGESPDTRANCHSVDAIIAVSGGDTGARTEEAIELYKHDWATKLIFSGAAEDKSGPSNAEAMRRRAAAAGVPDSDIIIEEYGETTRQNAENTQTIFGDNSITSVILVTSAYHQRRAELEFNKRSAGTVSVYSHPVKDDKQWSSTWWWLSPNGWYLAVSEFVKIIAFYIGGSR